MTKKADSAAYLGCCGINATGMKLNYYSIYYEEGFWPAWLKKSLL
jgi:hypothetical protein